MNTESDELLACALNAERRGLPGNALGMTNQTNNALRGTFPFSRNNPKEGWWPSKPYPKNVIKHGMNHRELLIGGTGNGLD